MPPESRRCPGDARGHARYRDDGATTRRLAYTFDGAERLTRVRVPGGSETCNSATETGTTWKQLTYATANSGSNARKGKLETATSRNELGPPAFPLGSVANVMETYTYQDRGGRVSNRVTAVSGIGVAAESWQVSGTTSELGRPELLTYPTCVSGAGCAGGPPAIQTLTSYEEGFLASIGVVGGGQVISSVSYHASGMPKGIVHGTGSPPPMTETIAQAGHGMARPQSITFTTSSSTPPNSFTTGTYSYDGAGNLEAMGADQFRYDRFQRLVEGQMGSISASTAQSMTFDVYGNITSTTTNGIQVNTETSTATNRLSSATYDAAGNLTAWNLNSYAWDPLNRLSHWNNTTEGWSYVYTADDERLWAIQDVAPVDGALLANWTFRGFGSEVLVRDERRPAAQGREAPRAACPGGPLPGEIFCDDFESGDTSEWSPSSAAERRTLIYGYRDGKLVAALELGGDYVDFGTDHLGSIRAATDLFGQIGAQHTYFPFGQEATSASQDAEVMKFTGHERDLQSTPSAPGDDFDYLHARFRSPLTGRFLSVDPAMPLDRTMRRPQMWNRYAYVHGNPLKYVDPTGELSWKAVKAFFNRLLGREAKDLTKPGPYAVEAVAGTASRNISKAAREELKVIGEARGCHTCGTKAFGTKSGNPIADHQPPIALNAEGKPYELLPQCTTCSARQGGQVSSILRSAADFIPGISGVMLALGLIEGGEDLARSAGDAVEQRVLASDAYQQLQQQEEIIQQIDE